MEAYIWGGVILSGEGQVVFICRKRTLVQHKIRPNLHIFFLANDRPRYLQD